MNNTWQQVEGIYVTDRFFQPWLTNKISSFEVDSEDLQIIKGLVVCPQDCVCLYVVFPDPLGGTVDVRNPAPPGVYKPCKKWDKLPTNWCRMSSITSMKLWMDHRSFVWNCLSRDLAPSTIRWGDYSVVYLHKWLIFMVHLGTYSIHGSFGRCERTITRWCWSNPWWWQLGYNSI